MTERRVWLVEYLPEAARELAEIGGRKEQLSAYTVVDKLVALGPLLGPPHMKSLQGEPNLMELRPRQGNSPVRLIYARVGDGYKVLTVCTKSGFASAASTARSRATKYGVRLGR